MPRRGLRLLAMNLDGNEWFGLTPMDRLKKGTNRITPLPHMRILKDLIPDPSEPYAQYELIEPWLQSDQLPRNRERSQGHIFRQPRGIYLPISAKGRLKQLLSNWPEKGRALHRRDRRRAHSRSRRPLSERDGHSAWQARAPHLRRRTAAIITRSARCPGQRPMPQYSSQRRKVAVTAYIGGGRFPCSVGP